MDQVAAAKAGQHTKFSSLELGCDRGAQAGNCDSGYSCSYSTNISWRTDTTPQAKEIDPKLAFERLFSIGAAGAARTKREKFNKSVLDFVLEDARDLQAKLGARTSANSTSISPAFASWKNESRRRPAPSANRCPTIPSRRAFQPTTPNTSD